MQYQPLDTDRNEIRLLTLLPGIEGSKVHCSLEHVSLINPPEYCALSYCWGDATITKGIIINETAVEVTTNLESALRHLRDKGCISLWVDAICINQHDKTERNQQLLWMGSIYRRAKEVEAWVGEEDEDSDVTFGPVSGEAFDFANRDEVAGLVRFLERPYWRRVWIIQELALARATILHCGQRDISWERMASIVQSKQLNTTSPALANIRNLVQFHGEATDMKPLRLVEALSRSCNASATDPRDKVFALLGLVYDSGYYLPIPNYRQSLRDLCVGMTLSGLSTTREFPLDLIALLGSGCDNMVGLPSWTPDWFGLTEMSSRRQCEYIVHGLPSRSGKPGTKYCASGNIHASAVMASDVLIVGCHFFDEVDGICPTLSEAGNVLPPAEWQSTSGFNTSRDKKTTYPGRLKGNVLTVLSRCPEIRVTRFGNTSLSFGICWHEKIMENFKHFLRPQTVSWILNVSHFIVQGWTLKELIRLEVYEASGRVPHASIYAEEIQKLEVTLDDNMRFMTTKKGRVGWAHMRSRKGDPICILEGCSVPVILRARAEGGFVLVGDAYVEGIMNGKLVAEKGVGWEEIGIH